MNRSSFRRQVLVLLLVTTGLVAVIYGISFVWPVYNFALNALSPDGRYDLMVLRGDKAAFDDFIYRIYIFPHDVARQEQAKGERVWMVGRWRGAKYLVYYGYSYPSFRWTGTTSVEIDLNDAYPEVSEFYPVKSGIGNAPISVSLVFGKQDSSNVRP